MPDAADLAASGIVLSESGSTRYAPAVAASSFDSDRAMDWLERAVTERTGPAYSIKGSFLLTPLHAHPRFRALLQQMKLE
jgi:hypothetical protein